MISTWLAVVCTINNSKSLQYAIIQASSYWHKLKEMSGFNGRLIVWLIRFDLHLVTLFTCGNTFPKFVAPI